MANKKISELNELISPVSTDTIPIINTGETKKVKLSNLIRQDITTGTEFATNEWIDGKQVYVRRFDCGTLLNTALKTINVGIAWNTLNIIKLFGTATGWSNTAVEPLPGQWCNMGIGGTNIYLESKSDLTTYYAYVTIYYTYR